MIENRLGEEQSSEESCDYYSLYKEDATLKKDTQPCSLLQLVRFSSIVDKLLMAMGCFFALGNGISLVFYAQPLKDLIMAFDPHSNPDEILANLTNAIKGFLINSIFVFLNASLMTIAWTLSSQRQLIRVRNLYFKSLLAQQFAWYDRNKPEEVCSQMYIQTQRAQNSLVESITGILASLSMGFGGLIFAFSRGWKMAIVMAGFLPVMFLTNYISSRLARKWENQLVDKASNSSSNIIEIFENIKTVKYLGGEQYQINRFSQQLKINSKNSIIYRRKTAITSAVTFFCIIFNYALGFWYGAKLVADKVYNSTSGKNYDVGDVISIFFCIYISNLNFSGISGHFNNFYNSRVALTRIIDIIDRRPHQTQGSQLCISGIQEIQFRNITFHFSQPLFNGLNLIIKKGIVAIVGSSGNGKSTLLNLLMKFYEPFKGQIFLNNANKSQKLKNIQAKSLRNRIGYVGQEPVLLGDTIRQVLNTNHNTDEAIWKALELCCAQQFTRNIGLDSNYKSLSGGQKQRIAIARAVLREPEILILDEGTSALDGINERKLLKNLKQRSMIKFIIMIAHRTETLSEAHTIIKIDRGSAEVIQNKENKGVVLIPQQPIQQSIKDLSTTEVLEQKKNENQDQLEQQKTKFKFKYFISLLKLNKRMFKHYLLGIITAMFLGVIFPIFSYIITRLCAIVTNIQYATSDLEVEQLRAEASQISLFLIIISFLSIIFTIVKIHSFLYIGQNIGLKTKIYAFKNLITRQMAQIQKSGKSNLIQLINNNCDSAKGIVSDLIENAAEHFFTLIVGLTISFVYCWQITLVSLFLLPMSLIGGKLQQKFLGSLAENSDKVHRKTHDIVIKSIIHNRTVKSLNLQDHFFQRYKKQQKKGFRKSIRDSIFSGIMLGISQCLISGMLSLIYYIGAILVDNYGVSIVDLFTAIYAIMFSGVQAGCNIGFIGSIATKTFGTARFFKVLELQNKDISVEFDENDERRNKNELVQELHDQSIIGSSDQIKGNIEFRGIAFKYPNRNEYLFKDLSFKVEENQRVAIVGQSGTGKTTIADLLFKIYRQEQGQVLIDGISSVFYSKSNILHQMGIVSQQPALFNRSIQQNIKYNTNASINDIQEAAKISKAFDFVQKGGFGVQEDSDERLGKIEGGNWNRVVGSRGSLLSGGQKQRVAIARAIVRKPKIMVFDEATSALDKQTQEQLLLNVSNNLKMTQIIIAHRLTTIRSCDRIIVLKSGKVVQVGTFRQLIQKGGQFANLVNALQKQQKS